VADRGGCMFFIFSAECKKLLRCLRYLTHEHPYKKSLKVHIEATDVLATVIENSGVCDYDESHVVMNSLRTSH
jgi:hypothetical protein